MKFLKNKFYSGAKGTVIPVSGGAPVLTSDNGTAQGAVLTVSPGATLYRNGLVKTAPYTTTADDALATFWAQVGSTRSSSIEIASSAPAPVAYDGIQIEITHRADGGSVSGDFFGMSEWQTRRADGTVIGGTDTTPNTLSAGTIGLLQDGDKYNGLTINPVALITFKRMFAASEVLANGFIDFAPDQFLTARAPGGYVAKGIVGTTVTDTLLTVTPGASYAVNSFTTFNIPGAGPVVTATWDDETNTVTLSASDGVVTDTLVSSSGLC